MGSKYLFVDWEGGGNLPPALTLTRQLVERGHRVRMLCDPADEADVVAVGCEFVPYTRAPHRHDKSAESDFLRTWEARTPMEALARSQERIMFGPALSYARLPYDDLSESLLDGIVGHGVLQTSLLPGTHRAKLASAIARPTNFTTKPTEPEFGKRAPGGWHPLMSPRPACLARGTCVPLPTSPRTLPCPGTPRGSRGSRVRAGRRRSSRPSKGIRTPVFGRIPSSAL
jgi:hypothetical protein